MLSYLKKECYVRSIVSLPTRTFYSTPKKTYVLALQRKNTNDKPQTTPVFTYLVSEIGESRDARRWVIEQNDLDEMVGLFNQFKGSPDMFSTQSPRCKVLPWSTFNEYRHWMIDRYWSIEELQALGEIEEPQELNVDEFNDLLSQTIGTRIKAPTVDTQFIEVALGDDEKFDLRIGDRVLKKNCVDDGIPCISANVYDIFGYIPSSQVLSDFDEPSLLWGVDGNFDWNLIEAGKPFHPTDHCGVLRVKDPNINPEYLYYTLQATRARQGYDRTYRANLDNVRQLMVRVPITEEGELDIELQRAIAEQYREIEQRKTRARELLRQVEEAQVTLDGL